MDKKQEDIIAAAAAKLGFGGAAAKLGVGCSPPAGGGSGMSAGGGGCGGDQPSVDYFLSIGSPTLALARARGMLAPWVVTINSIFSSIDVAPIVEQNADYPAGKILCDSFVTGLDYQCVNQSTPYASAIGAIGDFFYLKYLTGIEMKVRFLGRPGLNPVPAFTQLPLVPSAFNCGWAIRYTEQPQLDLQSTMLLAYAPILVATRFSLLTPRMQNDDYCHFDRAAKALKCEYDIDCCAD